MNLKSKLSALHIISTSLVLIPCLSHARVIDLRPDHISHALPLHERKTSELDHQDLVNTYRLMVYEKPAAFKQWIQPIAASSANIEHIKKLYTEVSNWALIGPDAFKNYSYLKKIAKSNPSVDWKLTSEAPTAPSRKLDPQGAPDGTPNITPTPVGVVPDNTPDTDPNQIPQSQAMARLFEDTQSFDEVARKIAGNIDLPIPFHVMHHEHLSNMPGYKQGWKLHVSATKENMYRIAKIVFPYLEKQNVTWKFSRTEEMYDFLCNSDTQAGKFITIYPPSDEESVRLAQEIDQLLLDNGLGSSDFIQPKYEAIVSKSGGVSTRYGSYEQHLVYIVNQQKNLLQPEPVEDNRYNYKPEFVTWNPFGSILVPPQLNN